MFFAIDHAIFRAIFAHGDQGALMTFAFVFSALGSGWSFVAIVPLLFSPRTRPFGQALIATLVITAVFIYGGKWVVGRDRPYLVLTDLTPAIIGSPTDHSFPSGHSGGSFTFALFTIRTLLDRAPRIRFAVPLAVLCALFAACVGVSRVILGAHFPSDVVGGAVIGATVGGWCGRRFTRRFSLRAGPRV